MDQKESRKLIALLFVGVLMGALDISIVGPAIPSIEKGLLIDERFAGWIFSVYVLFNLIGISLFARLSDIYGRRRIYVLALSIFAVGSVWVALSSNFNILIAGRAIQGFGASGIFPVASAVIGDLFPPEKRGRVLGMIGAVFGIAFLIGPFFAGVLLHFLPWNYLFVINIPVSLILIYYSMRILPSVPAAGFRRIDWGGIIAIGIALAGFTYSINSINALHWREDLVDPAIMLPFVVSAIAAVVLLFIEKKVPKPIIKFEFFSNRQIMIAGIIAVATGVVQASFVFVPRFVVARFQVSPSVASFMLTPFVLSTAIGAPLFGRMIDKYGVKKIILTGLTLLAAGFFLLSETGSGKALYYISGSSIGLGLSVLAGSSLRYIMLNNTTAEDRAVSQGMLTIFISIGQLFATAVIGLLLASVETNLAYKTLFTGVAVLSLLMLLVSMGLKNVIYHKLADH